MAKAMEGNMPILSGFNEGADGERVSTPKACWLDFFDKAIDSRGIVM